MSQTNLIAHTYNPHNQTQQELIDGFVVRKKEFEALYNDIKTDPMKHPPQHVIIQGRRGIGKTTFLLRLYYEVRQDVNVNKWLVPLIFNEEQYNVRTLYKLWENIAIELENDQEEFLNLPDEMQAKIEAINYDDLCFEILMKSLKKNKKKLLLLIDNFGEMLHKFNEKEQHRFREILMTSPDIKIIGASSVALESTYDYSKPFFEFFKIIELSGLNKEETITLLLALGEHYHKQEIKTIVEENPGKIEALRRLTDGIPRTMILLFEIFIDDAAGDSFKDLEMVLDRVTPLYKHRMDELSPQHQELVDIIALQWDAVAVKEIAAKARMESKAVSAQLRMLEKNKIIIKKETSTKNHLYQISERFFNIWYLMRYGRKKEKNQVRWLTRFLEEWCNREELVERAHSHMKALRTNTVYENCAYYMTEALAKTDLPYDVQDSLVKETRKYLREKGSRLTKDLSESDRELSEIAKQCFDEKKYDMTIKKLMSIRTVNKSEEYNIALCHDKLNNYSQAEKYYKIAIKSGHIGAMNNLGMLYEKHNEFVKAEENYKMACENGNPVALNNLAIFYENKKKDYIQAEKYYKISSEKGYSSAMFNLALLYQNYKKDLIKAEYYYKLAIEKGHAGAMNNLAIFYEEQKKDWVQTELYFKMACENGNKLSFRNLAWSYFLHGVKKEIALDYVKKAVEQNDDIKTKLTYAIILIWNNLVESATAIAKPIFEDGEIYKFELLTKTYLMLILAKKQYSFAHKLFTESKIELRERLKPIYYALMYFMKNEYPDEMKKMGSELEQTVMEIVEEIKEMAKTM